jgi:hypothetical protein
MSFESCLVLLLWNNECTSFDYFNINIMLENPLII